MFLCNRNIGCITKQTPLSNPHYISGRPDFGLRAGHVHWWFCHPSCRGSFKNAMSIPKWVKSYVRLGIPHASTMPHNGLIMRLRTLSLIQRESGFFFDKWPGCKVGSIRLTVLNMYNKQITVPPEKMCQEPIKASSPTTAALQAAGGVVPHWIPRYV